MIVLDPGRGDGAPTIEGTGVRVKDIAVADEHSGSGPDEVTRPYPDFSLGGVRPRAGGPRPPRTRFSADRAKVGA